jgi:hypothetical protein
VLVYVPRSLPGFGPSPEPPDDGLDRELDLGWRFGPLVERATPAFPFFTMPAASGFATRSTTALDLRDDSWVPLIGAPDAVLAATRQLERGRVYAVASTALFANHGIGEVDNAAFVLNVLARHPAVRTVAFDEYHHGVVSPPDLISVMRGSPWGWAVVYAALLSFAFALWGGRRFGPAIVPERVPGRSAGDYITAFAGLLQRARAAGWAQATLVMLVSSWPAYAAGGCRPPLQVPRPPGSILRRGLQRQASYL